jgi:F-type H+-transporting ATPase subunit b
MASGQGNQKLGDNVAANAHTGVDGHGKAGFPPFQSETFASQLVSFAIAFALLYLIVSRLALPRVGGIIAARQSVIDADLDAAAKLQADSDAALLAYETELANARARAQGIASEVREQLSAQQDLERKALEQRLAGQLAGAEAQIATTRQSAMGNVRAIAADAASAIVERLTGTTPNAGAVVSALDGALKG